MPKEYVELTEDEARGYSRLWRIFEDYILTMDALENGLGLNINVHITKLVSIAVDHQRNTCGYCGTYDQIKVCQCWNDE